MKGWKIGVSLVLALSLIGCNGQTTQKTLESGNQNQVEVQKLIPVNTQIDFSYNDVTPIIEETLRSYESENGLARIEKKQSYYEVYLDLEKGSHYDVGYGYGEVIKQAYPDFANIMEPYLYENIYMAFPELTDDFTPINERMEQIKRETKPEYLEEMEGLVEALAVDSEGFIMNGKLSQEEVSLLHFIPDVLRGTQCSGVAVYGGKSATGHTITVRILDWLMGNENQMATAHAVVHFKNGEKSFTSYGVLGLLQVISASNTEGVFAGILDSSTDGVYSVENKKSYPFELRYAIENFASAKEVGEYMSSQGKAFTFSHNILVTDSNQAYVIENAMDEEGKCALREASSPLMNGVTWNHDEAIAVVNSFALEGNKDNMTDSSHNMIRWKKFNERLAEYPEMTVGDLKDIVTRDDPNEYGSNIYSENSYQVIVVDSETGSVDIAFAPASDELPLKPDFIRVTEILYEEK